MIFFDNTKRMIIGGWILSALTVLAFSGYALLTLFSVPIVGYSSTVKSVNLKRQQLAAQMPAADAFDKKLDLSRFDVGSNSESTPEVEEEHKTPPHPMTESAPVDNAAPPPAPQPPALKGVLRIVDHRGKAKLVALLGGKLLTEKDRINNFMVKRISEKGVLVTRGSESWFLPAPEIPFSLTREE